MQFFPMAIAQPPTAQSSITNNAQVAPEDWLQRGRETYQNGLYAKAAEYWLNAANLYQRDKLNLALVWNYLSLAYQQLNRFDEAKNAISTSLDLLAANQNTDTTAQRQQILARSLTTSARLELANGQAENALDSLKQAEAIYKQIGDMPGVIGSQINQAQALQALGRYRRALQTLNQVEETLKKPETFNTQLDPLIKATKLYSLGNTLQVVGDLEHSWCVFQDSLAVAEQLQNSQLIGDIYLSLGNTARAFGRRVEDLQGLNSQQKLPLTIPKNCQKPPQEDTALGFYKQAGEWYEKVAETESFSDSTRLQAQLNYLNILVSVLSTEAWKDSWPNYLAEVDKLWPNIYDRINSLPPSRQEVYAKINLTKNLILLNKKSSFNQPWSIIDQLLQQAIAHAKNLEDPKAQTYALGTYGWLYEEQKNYGEAQKFTEQALSLANEIQAPNIKYQWEWQLGRIYAAQENLKDAIAAYEKALETINVVRKGLVGIPLDLAGINSDIQFYFRDNVEPIYREAVDLVLRSENPDLEKVRQLIDNLQVAELENYLQCSLQNANFLEIEQIPHTTEVVVIYPILLNDRIEVIFSLPSGASTNRFLHRYTSVDTPKTKVEQTLKELRRQLELEFPDSKARKLSQQVYDWIIRPAEKDSLLEPTKNQTLVFVLDGLLRNIPMAALYDGKDYLIEKLSRITEFDLDLRISDRQRNEP
ncbi:tetratricopeptide repeat protein [Planktothrix sp. FACHB-1355]|uniref:Tetratricopeptide repeat protein n=1 Tax=Aerosakkonema funiforme FACHB-1375 TaxID=2949571 RepID=A0A926VLY6_9CYAN|nr:MULTISPECIES: tetratricopeptide repeat protein [Oscillatoriales]MBD2186139.1 tetratricopeptide repeat protein [Aerosakkonema funiforme FACHB-1375]MBD3558603.1 tetratricopeptide repeat protein [Planktothrix sp. FACHB-1355]